MSILIALIIGLGIGAAGQYFLQKEPDTLLISVICGTAGSMLGLVAFVVLDFDAAISELFSLPAILFCTLGALLGTVTFAAIHIFMEKRTSGQVETAETESDSKAEKDPVQEKEKDS